MELLISMIPSPEDPPWMSDAYQADLRNLGLMLSADGLDINDVASHSGCPPAMSGEWRVTLGATLGPKLGAPVGSWLQARRGRIVHVTIGMVEVDVRTVDELVSVIKIANCYQKIAEDES
jgi:hypothetical protein